MRIRKKEKSKKCICVNLFFFTENHTKLLISIILDTAGQITCYQKAFIRNVPLVYILKFSGIKAQKWIVKKYLLRA